MAQLSKGKHLRRQRPPQSGAIHRNDVISQLTLDRVDDGGCEHGTVASAAAAGFGSGSGIEGVEQGAKIGAAQARARRIVNQNPIIGSGPLRQELESVRHRVLPIDAAEGGVQLGRGESRRELGPVSIVRRETQHHGVHPRLRQQPLQRPFQHGRAEQRGVLLGSGRGSRRGEAGTAARGGNDGPDAPRCWGRLHCARAVTVVAGAAGAGVAAVTTW